MDYIQTSNKQIDKFGAGKHGFSAGNPSGGVQATFLSPEFCDDVMMEIINVIESGGGLVPAAATRNQMKQAIDIMIRKLAGSVVAAGGTVDALTGAFTPAVTALSGGMRLQVAAAGANTSTTPTFKADALAAKTIVKAGNKPLEAGDIAGAGHWLNLIYDAGLDKFVLMNPANGVNQVGFGQTWQDLTASRAFSTTYTNTTGRPILVVVNGSISTTSASTITATINGVGPIYGTTAYGVAANGSALTVIVPPGATYSFAMSGAAGTLFRWHELR